MSFFPYETISDYFEDQGDFPENQEEHACTDDCNPGNCEVAHHDYFWGEEDYPEDDLEMESWNPSLLDLEFAEDEGDPPF